jgi:hypothetical protein
VDDDARTEDQQEWADWAEHGYAKRWTPRSVLRTETVAISIVIAVLLVIVFVGFR